MKNCYIYPHSIFRSVINYYYEYPILTAREYQNIHNAALRVGVEIIAIFSDGIAYRNI